ncbi:AraC family transcriptional regulator [Allorhodopirellula solitaria]|uniref:HTH-type transcriptional activator Btr n=1 Tax=Allorhodopirellula solitaria TaxID=2527987 RepID=A0A5C5X0I9_9BACT|nr:helix-turn-helix domain-containing protein [Allorhodopirellula solitaria]TWT55722.1 HTH-type transcriptional activator Btr [Allorhodopirellula solitaria]
MTVDPDFVSRQTHDARRFYLNLQPSQAQPLSLVCGGVERMDADYVVERSSFPYHAIEWVSEGRGILEMGGKEHELAVGSMFAYGPGIPHRIRNLPPENMRKYYLDLAGTEATERLTELGLLDGRPVTIGRPHEFVELWNLIDREARDVGEHSHSICEMLTCVFLRKIQQRLVSAPAGESSEASQTFEMACHLIGERFLDFRTVEEVAAELGFSPVYLSRLFKRFTGSGAYRYLLRLRMNYAAELLVERGLQVSAVAKRLGYADAFQFSRAFKRVYGVPPSSLAKTFSAKAGQ